MAHNAFLDIGIGDRGSFASAVKVYDDAQVWLAQNGAKYSLPASFEDLDAVQLETLSSIYPGAVPSGRPASLVAGRLVIALDPSSGLQKTRDNFVSLCRGDKGMCKNAPNKRLHFFSSPIHRIVKDFIAQGGDITRGDGSGGEVGLLALQSWPTVSFVCQSIYGGKFNDEKPGLKAKPVKGSIAMANAGKNSNTSQFFVVLASDPAQLKKIEGKYIVFGSVVEGSEVLDRLNEVGSKDGTPTMEVWVDDCGVI